MRIRNAGDGGSPGLCQQVPQYEDDNSPALPLNAHLPRKKSVAVLGVMLPGDVPQPCDVAENLLPLSPDVPQQSHSKNVIFYDPLSSDGSFYPAGKSKTGSIDQVSVAPEQHREKFKGGGQLERMKAMKSVARDLAALALRKEM